MGKDDNGNRHIRTENGIKLKNGFDLHRKFWGGYWICLENCKEEISTEVLAGNRKIQERSTEWEWGSQRKGYFIRKWSRYHFIWTILIWVLVWTEVWWIIHVVIFTNTVVVHSTLSKNWPSLILSCQCQSLMGFTRSTLPHNNGNLPLPFFGGYYPIVLLNSFY